MAGQAQIWQLVALLLVHWVADFVMQTQWMAENKSRRLVALGAHVLTYSSVLGVATVVMFGATQPVLWFIAVNAGLHFATDFVTSRISAEMWRRQNVHAFFICIGFDQLLHQIALAATLVAFL